MGRAIKRPLVWLGVICAAALLFRLALLPMVQHPAIADSNHYYNLAQRLLDGHGFTIDYIWQFNHLYETIEHPADYWTPLTGVLAALSMSLFGRTPAGAVVLTAVLGALVPMLAYIAARRLALPPLDSLCAALVCAFIPELVLNSLRTDTTIPNGIMVVSALLLLPLAVAQSKALWFMIAGALIGLGYLFRTDSSLVVGAAGIVTLIAWARGIVRPRWRVLVALLLPLTALMVVAPWLMRNLTETGSLTTPNLSQMFFLTDYREHYVYDNPLTLDTLLATQTPQQIIARRLFELVAALRLMITMLDVGLPIAVAGGILLLLRQRERHWALLPLVVMVTLLLIFYPLLVPFKSQGGSFKKAYLSLLPLIVPIGAYALHRAVPDVRLRVSVVVLTAFFMALNAFDLVRRDNAFVNNFVGKMQRVVAVLETLPDTNDDGRLILMTQDPFVLRYLGNQGVQFPFEDRDTIVFVAQKYGVDYLLMPSARPALEPLELGTEADPRFRLVERIPGTAMSFWRVEG